MTAMLTQVPLTILSLLAIFCVTSRSQAVQKWGPVFGLCSQPFWLWATYSAQQWGMLLLSFVYVGMWVRGIRNAWTTNRKT